MPEPADVSSVLLELATADEFAARSLLPIVGITDGVLGFHAQQAVEKALKAVLAVNDVDFPYSHDLNGLIGLCRNSNIDVPDDLAGVGHLSVFAVRLRYDASPAAHLDRDQALVWATAAVTWARAQLEAAQAPAADEDEVSD
jgi:hypothetical protein